MPLSGHLKTMKMGGQLGRVMASRQRGEGRSLNDVKELEHEVDLESAEAPKTVGPH